MFTIEEIKAILTNAEFQEDLNFIQQVLIFRRYDREFAVKSEQWRRLSHFVEAVLSSAPSWQSDDAHNICRTAAEFAEVISIAQDLPSETRRRMRIRSCLLYELAGLPSLANAILEPKDLSGLLDDLFFRKGFFRLLTPNGEIKKYRESPQLENTNFLDKALSSDALYLAEYEQGASEAPNILVSTQLIEIAKNLSLGMSATELSAFAQIIRMRVELATRSNVENSLFWQLKEIKFPAELWSTQIKAIKGGLTDPAYDSWGFAAPTGTGKTFLSRLLIAKLLLDNPSAKIVYVVPSRALVHEVWAQLSSSFEKLKYKIVKVSPQLSELGDEEHSELIECSVAVLTPEKADLLLRLGVDFLLNTSLIIIDEAHHIENGNRGILLELYLWRIKQILNNRTRIVFLSAVAPNIQELAEWMGKTPNAVTVDQRSTRMRVGVYRIKKSGRKNEGWIDYNNAISLRVVENGVAGSQSERLLQLAGVISSAGPVLVVAKGKGTCESLAEEMKEWLNKSGKLRELTKREANSDEYYRLDSRLEREMYESVKMRSLLRSRIAYHHAGLPPRVRVAVEEAIRSGLIDFVFATTTLAEGVNFPFSSVIVQSLALRETPEKGKPARYQPVTPRTFWNIAGRAGRPGFDREGQAILFEASLGIEKVNLVLEQFLDSSLNGVEPVRSALAQSLKEIKLGLEQKDFTSDELNTITLPPEIPKKVRGTVNLIRVGLIHAKASNIANSVEEILHGSFAERFLDETEKRFAQEIVSNQSKVVDDFFKNDNNAITVDMVAEIGLSIETLTELRNYVQSLSNWQLERFSQIMFGGEVNITQAQYLIGPVAKHMSELDGSRLGGFYANIIVNWLSGYPLTTVKSRTEFRDSIEDLISIIYSRIQYLLPWGLYATHRLVEEETKQRDIHTYTDEILSLAFLVDAGVPSFDALRLVGLEIERVDATRLARAYKKQRRSVDTDIISWLANQQEESIIAIVRGSDSRPIDYDLFHIIGQVKLAK